MHNICIPKATSNSKTDTRTNALSKTIAIIEKLETSNHNRDEKEGSLHIANIVHGRDL